MLVLPLSWWQIGTVLANNFLEKSLCNTCKLVRNELQSISLSLFSFSFLLKYILLKQNNVSLRHFHLMNLIRSGYGSINEELLTGSWATCQ